MLDFTLDSIIHHQAAADPAANNPSRRLLADRRISATVKSTAPSMTPKRRRHDSLNTGKPAPLEW